MRLIVYSWSVFKKKKKENKNEKQEAIVAIKNLFRWLVQLASLRVESLYLKQRIIEIKEWRK